MVELNLTKRQQEIFDFVKRYGSEHGYPPTVRDIGKAIGLTSSSTVHAHLGEPREARAAAARPDQAARDRGAGRQGQGSRWRRAGCRSSARSRPVSRCSPRRTSRSTSPVPGDRRRRRRRVRPPREGRLDEGRRHPRGRLRGGPPRRTRPRTARSSWRCVEERGDRQALLQGERPRAPPAGERRARADPTRATSRCSGAWSVCAGGSRDARRCWKARAAVRRRAWTAPSAGAA